MNRAVSIKPESLSNGMAKREIFEFEGGIWKNIAVLFSNAWRKHKSKPERNPTIQ